LTHQSNAVF